MIFKEFEDAYCIWLKYIQTITVTKKREDGEKAYEQITEDETRAIPNTA